MKDSLEQKLQQLLERFQEVGRLLSEPSIISDQSQFKNLSKEYAQLEPLATCYDAYLKAITNKESLQKIADEEEDPELAQMAKEELTGAEQLVEELEEKLQWHLIPKDPSDERNIYLEIRAGTGGMRQPSLLVIYLKCITVTLKIKVGK